MARHPPAKKKQIGHQARPRRASATAPLRTGADQHVVTSACTSPCTSMLFSCVRVQACCCDVLSVGMLRVAVLDSCGMCVDGEGVLFESVCRKHGWLRVSTGCFMHHPVHNAPHYMFFHSVTRALELRHRRADTQGCRRPYTRIVAPIS